VLGEGAQQVSPDLSQDLRVCAGAKHGDAKRPTAPRADTGALCLVDVFQKKRRDDVSGLMNRRTVVRRGRDAVGVRWRAKNRIFQRSQIVVPARVVLVFI
jgi:hypothetical protein